MLLFSEKKTGRPSEKRLPEYSLSENKFSDGLFIYEETNIKPVNFLNFFAAFFEIHRGSQV